MYSSTLSSTCNTFRSDYSPSKTFTDTMTKNKMFDFLSKEFKISKTHNESSSGFNLRKDPNNNSYFLIAFPIRHLEPNQTFNKVNRKLTSLKRNIKLGAGDLNSFRNRPTTKIDTHISCRLNIREQVQPFCSDRIMIEPLYKRMKFKRPERKKDTGIRSRVDDRRKNKTEFEEYIKQMSKYIKDKE